MVTNVKVRAPSSTANLGPGFDVFGLALDAFYDEITLSKTNKSITTNRSWHGVRILTTDDVPKDPQQNTAGLVVKAMKQKFKIKSGIEIRIKKGVPAGFGMGSSAASATAAALAFNKLFNLKLDSNTLIKCAGIGEKASAGTIHYDNVAAFERFTVKSDNLTVFGITALEIFVFFFGTFNCGIAIHKTRSFGGFNLTTSNGFVFTITNPPSNDAATLS